MNDTKPRPGPRNRRRPTIAESKRDQDEAARALNALGAKLTIAYLIAVGAWFAGVAFGVWFW